MSNLGARHAAGQNVLCTFEAYHCLLHLSDIFLSALASFTELIKS